MAFVLNDRVKETTTTTGTGAVTLGGTSTGFQTFAAGIGNSNTCYYAIVHQTANEWETGLGTLNGDSSTLTRTAVYESTNSDSAEDFAAGTKDVFCTLPASKTPSQILTTANDLIYANSANTPARLAAGTGNQVLKMNSTGTAIAWAADSAGVSLTGSTDNTVTTVTGADAIQGEANLTFDGSTLAVTGAITSTTTATIGTDLTVTGSDITLGNGANSTVKNEATAHNTAGKTMTITSGTPTAGPTSDIAGGSLTLQGGQGKGTGAGGDIIFQTANASTSASTLNSYATALTLSDDLSATFGGVTDIKSGAIFTASQAANDLFYANSATAIARLAKGTGSQVLSMNATATAIAWAAAAGGGDVNYKNGLINGDFAVAQRGTSFTSTDRLNNDDTYNLDRWYLLSDGNDIVDVTQSSTAPDDQLTSIALDVETANKKFGIAQIIENTNCTGLIGQTCTLSFKAKCSAVDKLDNIKCAIVSWDSTADSVTSDLVSAWGVEGTNPTLASDWTYENSPANLNVTDTTAGQFIYITDVQLEAASSATDFERVPYQFNLMSCQRYFEICGSGFAGGTNSGGDAVDGSLFFKVSKRITGWSGAIEKTGGLAIPAIIGMVISSLSSVPKKGLDGGYASMSMASTYTGTSHVSGYVTEWFSADAEL